MASTESKLFTKYVSFAFVFIFCFLTLNVKSLELFGLGLFFVVNLIFCIFIGKDLTYGTISSEGRDTEWIFRYWSLIISVVFSFVSSIMMIMTLLTLQSKFAEHKSEIKWSPSDRSSLNNAETAFMMVTAFIGIASLYVYNSPEHIKKLTNDFFRSMLDNTAADWLRVSFPILTIVFGSALYGRLTMSPLEVKKTPTQVVCDPINNGAIQEFKKSFIKTYWFCFAFVIVVLSRPLIERYFIGGPFIFGQNPLITIPFSSIPIARWDVFYLLAKYAFGIAGLVYAGFSITHFSGITSDDPCLYDSTYIRQLYIAFIFLLVTFYVLNTLSSSVLTSVSSGVMRYAVPPGLLALSSYLVFITNYFVNMAPKLIVQ